MAQKKCFMCMYVCRCTHAFRTRVQRYAPLVCSHCRF